MLRLSGDFKIDLKTLIEMSKGFIWILENDHNFDLEVSKDFIKEMEKKYINI